MLSLLVDGGRMRVVLFRFHRGSGYWGLDRRLDGRRRGRRRRRRRRNLNGHGTMLLQYIALLPMGVEQRRVKLYGMDGGNLNLMRVVLSLL